MRMRPLSPWIAMVTVLLIAAGCSNTVAGRPAVPGYQPVSPGAATVSQQQLPDKVLAVSADLRLAVVRTQDQAACLVSFDAPDTVIACADLPEAIRQVFVEFSPDGRRYSVLENYQVTYRSDVWIVEAATGATRHVDVASALQRVSSGSGSAAAGTTSVSGSSTGGKSQQEPMLFQHWRSDTELVGVSGATVIRVDAATGRVSPVGSVSGERPFVDLAVFGETAAAVLIDGSATVVDLDTGTVSAPVAVDVKKGARPLLLGISPDGTKLLVSSTDLVRFVPGPTSVISIADRKTTTFEQPATTFTYGGSFSPDGSQVLLVSTDNLSSKAPGSTTSGSTSASSRRTKDLQVQLVAAAGGAPRTIGTTTEPMYGPLSWSRYDVVTSGPPINSVSSAIKIDG